MHRALSAEQLADFAHQAVAGLRRLVSNSNFMDAGLTPTQQDLSSTTKQIDDMGSNKKSTAKVDKTVVELWCHSFADELDHLLLSSSQQLQAAGAMSSSTSDASLPSSPKVPQSPAPLQTRKPVSDALLLQAVECVRVVERFFPHHALECFQSVRLLDKLIKLLHMNIALPKKTCEALQMVLIDVLGELPGAMNDVLQVFEDELRTASEGDALTASTHIRRLTLFIASTRRHAVVCGGDLSRSSDQDVELMRVLLQQLRELRRALDADIARQGRAITSGVLTLVAMFCAARGHEELKNEFLKQPDARDLWVFLASNVARMDTIITYSVTLPNGRAEERALSIDAPSVWAAEIAEFLVEMCTTDSFCMKRQQLFGLESAVPQTPPALARASVAAANITKAKSSAAASATGASSSSLLSRRWETLPTNWDATLTSGSTLVWRLAAMLSPCKLQTASVRPLLYFVGLLDTTNTVNTTAEFIFRCVVSSVLLLCNATPANVSVLAEAGAFEILIEMLTASRHGSTVFPRRCADPAHQLLREGEAFKFGESSRQILLSLLAVLASMHMRNTDISSLMCAVEGMRQSETTAEDCEVIEHVLTVIGGTTYARQPWFFGGDTTVVCSVEKFVGRWYGYTFSAWVNPLCVWGEGCALFSFAEPATPSAVVVCIVANGRSRSLAVRTSNNKDFSIALIPDTALCAEGWTHIGLVHNIGGFTVYINGKKTNNSVSVPFPKEPPKPHRLMFGLGCDCSDGVNADASTTSVSSSPGPKAVNPVRTVPSLFGQVSGMELVDGALGEKDFERIAAAGPQQSAGSGGSSEPMHTNQALFSVLCTEQEVDVSGSLAAKREYVHATGMIPFAVPDVPNAFVSLGVVSWAIDVLKSVDVDCPNRNIIAVLCIEFISTAFKLASSEELRKYHELRVIEEARSALLRWDSGGVPPQISNGILSIAIPRGSSKRLRTHVTTSAVFSLLLDLLSSTSAPSFHSCTLKDLSEVLSEPENAKFFREQPSRFTTLLLSAQMLPQDAIDDFVALLEKLCKEPLELEHLLRFVAFQEASRHSELVSCEILRMLYDVARPNVVMCEHIAAAFNGSGVWWLVYLIQGHRHRSEPIRICSTKLLALVLHCSKKAKDAFVKANGFDLLAAAAAPPHAAAEFSGCFPLGHAPVTSAPPIRLMTYNCFFKFALDFYTPNNTPDSSSSKPPMVPSNSRHVDPRSSGGAVFGFHGHLPGVLPTKHHRRGLSVDLGYGSECGDVEVRLSVDDVYSAQTASKDLLVYPQGIHVVLQMLGRNVQQVVSEAAPSLVSSEDPSRDGLGSDDHQSATASITNSRKEDEQLETILKVLAFLDRIVDMTPNASALVSFPWLEWLWAAVQPIFAATGSAAPLGVHTALRQLRGGVEVLVRSIIRKVFVVDLTRTVKGSMVRRVKDLVDEPLLQQIVFEEIVRHFSDNNRLDTMDPNEATNCIRNLDGLLQGIDESIFPFPNSLAVEVVFAIRAIVVNNNTWVRLKMKSSTKLFEVRDKLAFLLMTSIKEFSKESPDFLPSLVEVNIQDLNTLLVVLKGIVDAVQHRNLEEVETLQGMLRMLYTLDDEQRKYLQRVLDVDSVELLQQRSADGSGPDVAVAPDRSTQQDFISWCMSNEGRWDAIVQKILKAFKPVETDIRTHNERRDNQRVAKLKNRKAEVEKRATLLTKSMQDLDKLRGDIEGKGMQQYQEARHEAEAMRRERDAAVA